MIATGPCFLVLNSVATLHILQFLLLFPFYFSSCRFGCAVNLQFISPIFTLNFWHLKVLLAHFPFFRACAHVQLLPPFHVFELDDIAPAASKKIHLIYHRTDARYGIWIFHQEASGHESVLDLPFTENLRWKDHYSLLLEQILRLFLGIIIIIIIINNHLMLKDLMMMMNLITWLFLIDFTLCNSS